MYDLPELRQATDEWWRGLARHLGPDMPLSLTRADDLDRLWADPALAFSQSCGGPLTTAFEDRLVPLATPCYGAAGCDGPHYRSAIIVGIDGSDEIAGSVIAVNYWGSHSGWTAPAALVAPLARGGSFFRAARLTGSHAESVAAVAAGRADCAAVDAVTYALLARHRPQLVARTRILAWSPPAPGLPYVTRRDRPAAELAAMRAGLSAALADPQLAAAREALLIRDLAFLDLADYQPIHDLAAQAAMVARPPVLP